MIAQDRGGQRCVERDGLSSGAVGLPLQDGWLTPERVVALSVAVGAAALTDPALRLVAIRQLREPFLPGLEVQWLITATTVWLSVALASRALAADSVASAAARSVLGGILFGALNAGLALVFLTASSGHLGAVLGALIVGFMFGGIFYGGPLGFIFGVLYAPVVGAGIELRRRPTHQGLAGLTLWAGTWLALVGLFSAGLSRAPYLVLSWTAFLFGVELIVFALVRDLRMAGFVADVEATLSPDALRGETGASPPWRIVPRGSVADTGLRPLWAESAADPCDGVLVACGPTVSAPYREQRAETPVALVPLELRGIRQAAGRRAAAALLLLLGLLWAGLAMLA